MNHGISFIRRLVLSLTLLLMPSQLAAQISLSSPHGAIRWDCESCHTPSGWTPLKKRLDFKHNETGFPLLAAHGSVECSSCHQSLEFAAVGSACADCHSDIHQAEFGNDCATCHSPESWENVQGMLELHAERGFPLTGVHTVLDCQACHLEAIRNEFAGLSSECFSCHQETFQQTDDPSHVAAAFSLNCESCHQPLALTWENGRFEHDGDFLLQGVHVQAECAACHQTTFAGLEQDCFSCHAQDFQSTTLPAHAAAGFPTDCQACHNETRWEDAVFDHVDASGFDLRGTHDLIDCVSCHVDNQLAGLPRDCFGCHEEQFAAVPEPNHVSAGFPEDCLVCHNEVAWRPASFDHNMTGFPLTGVHLSLECADCHSQGFENTPADCYSCHQVEFESVTEPNHVQNNFSQLCLDCHTTSEWEPATFDHAGTDFPLTGAHISLDCVACHSEGYVNTPTDCYSCHQVDFESVTEPNHVQNNFSQLCLDCHTTSEWEPATFDHAGTDFPLTGAHMSLDCIACHSEGYVNTPTDCYSCHQSDFEMVVDPNHVQNNFSQMCLDCHTTSEWEPATFDHAGTDFPLTGAHLSLDCIACHSEGYVNTPTDCYSCHQSDFEMVVDPNHVQNNFSQMCFECHSTSAWSPATFDHAGTDFPLTGAHLSLDCIACHSEGYVNTPTDCYSCHQSDFEMVVDPNHVQNNFSQLCLECHSTSAWSPATFDHSGTDFPLTGAHLSLDCIACHSEGYVNTPTDCYSCHDNDYNNTSDPDHQAAGFPTECETCHNTSDWEQTTWNHDQLHFPIYSGRHEGEWAVCADCHVNPANFQDFECITCHEHNQSDMDEEHEDVPGYVYESGACFSCHPDGEEKRGLRNWMPKYLDRIRG